MDLPFRGYYCGGLVNLQIYSCFQTQQIKFKSLAEDTVRPWSRPSVPVSMRSTVTRFKQLWQQFTTTLHLNRSCVKVIEIWKFQNSTNNDFFAVGQGVPQLHKCIWIRSCKINTSTAQNRYIIENHIFFKKKIRWSV